MSKHRHILLVLVKINNLINIIQKDVFIQILFKGIHLILFLINQKLLDYKFVIFS